MRRIAILIILAMSVALLSACRNAGTPGAREVITESHDEAVNEARKSYPIPEGTVINNTHGDTVNYTTTTPVDQVVDFYRKAYARLGINEISEVADVSSYSASLVFRNPAGDKNIYIQIEKVDAGSKVRLEKK
jgi:hypothetical protein